MNTTPILQCTDVRKSFPKPEGADLLVAGIALDLGLEALATFGRRRSLLVSDRLFACLRRSALLLSFSHLRAPS